MSVKKNIPLVDLHAQYLSIKPEIDDAMATVIRETSFIRGPHVERFEAAYASAMGVKHCISCANGTDAIYIALKMLGVSGGDEVITTANSWISTSEVISQAGATPVFIDVEDAYQTLDVKLIEGKLSARTKAIIPVHLLGQCADMDPILCLARDRGIPVIEDCAQAHLARYRGRMAGTMGDVGTYSFYPGKNLGAYGDAGAIVTDNDELAKAMRCYARHGSDPSNKHDHVMEGINSRLDGMQAAILSVKLPYLEAWTEARRSRAERYTRNLNGVLGVRVPSVRAESTHVWHVYSILVNNSARLMSGLAELGISTTQHYPTPLPLLKAYSQRGFLKTDFPVAVRHAQQMVSLPIYPELSDADVDMVSEAVIRLIAEM
jgi:dTDP-4-amino-4,6-dideoxygalactose transaminase